MKARTLLLMCGLSLAGAAAAEPIDAPLHGHDGWLFERPDQRNNLRHGHADWPFGKPDKGDDQRRSVPHTAQVAAIIPLPRPRPHMPEKTGAIQDNALNAATPAPPTAPMPQPTRLAAPGPENAPVPQPASALLSATETPKWAAVEPAKDDGGAAVSIRDAGGGRVQIEAHDASVGQVLTALQESHLLVIQSSVSDQLSRAVTGTYTGTLPQVLSRILDGSSYFLRETASGTELYAADASSRTNAALRSPSRETNAVLRSAASDTNAAVQSALSSNVEATTAPATPTPVSEAQAWVTPSPAEKARARAQRSSRTH